MLKSNVRIRDIFLHEIGNNDMLCFNTVSNNEWWSLQDQKSLCIIVSKGNILEPVI